MATINLSKSEETLYRDFNEGNSVQVRVTVPAAEEREYEKGKTVTVVFEDREATGKIVSDPLVVNPKTDDGREVISLIVEKTGK